MITLTNRQARQFLLLKHGLLGEYRFTGKQGALEFIRQAGCIQFDPVDICGRNAELTLQSRVKDFSKDTLSELLYKDRKLFDYPDKCLSIIPIEDWPYFERYRQLSRDNAGRYPEMETLIKQVSSFIETNGTVCSDDIKIDGEFYWQSTIHWSAGTRLSRSVLEQMYSTGDLIIRRKNGTRKYYDFTVRYIPAKILSAPEPLPDDFNHQKWRVLRRIGAIGLLWNRPSDAWLNIWGFNNEIRERVFNTLIKEKKIIAVTVEGLRSVFYCRAGDMPLIKTVLQNPKPTPRCEFIAPLDCFMWDRKLIKALFDFDYSWEIYTAPHKRKYGVYVLPLLFGEQFIGRIETVCERKAGTLIVKNIWYEDGITQTKKLQTAINGCLKRFAKFNGCTVFDPR